MQIEKSKTIKGRDFRLVLQDELSARCAKNPSYSLRSFARALAISPAALSDILSGKRPVTDKMKERLGFQLGFSPSELSNLKSQPHGNSKSLAKTDTVFQPVTIDVFSIIAEPYHYALLELIKTQGFEWDNKWIAQRLGLTVSEAKIAIERLERVGLLERNEDGVLEDATEGFRSDLREGLSSEAQRRSLIRAYEVAITAIRTMPVDVRDNTTMTMAINENDLPKAKKMIKEFRRKFCVDLESNARLNEVYQLGISFVPLSNLKNNRGSQK